ncbi:hypothetical protein U8527_14195 [Kordia algicida OT-1]|uniref:Uncharacterized protein n=1 Tax=Kordia algicida OT-1 TaxID=391587 RepID=A9DXW6_9FLAO|nr:hypothetical protein [Kordia algicida]EDP96055.1 hypothetical protein KAOT1_07798 [Kordia algicida OT-1]
MEQKTIDEGRQTAIISYITIIGLVIAISMNVETKNEFARMHIRQSLGLNILFYIISFFIGYFNSLMISGSFYVFFIVLWVFGLTNAIQREYKPIPLLGDYFQDWFKSV